MMAQIAHRSLAGHQPMTEAPVVAALVAFSLLFCVWGWIASACTFDRGAVR